MLYFVPALNFNGDVIFNYAAKDDLGLASTADGTATITVISVNDAPVVNNVTASGNEDAASISITLAGSDVDGTIDSFDWPCCINHLHTTGTELASPRCVNRFKMPHFIKISFA